MANSCYSCGKALQVLDQKIVRSSICEYCNVDLHCCLNCSFYDTSAYNECHEINAERVLDKKKANFCDCFEWNSSVPEVKKDDAQKAMDALKSLFKSN